MAARPDNGGCLIPLLLHFALTLLHFALSTPLIPRSRGTRAAFTFLDVEIEGLEFGLFYFAASATLTLVLYPLTLSLFQLRVQIPFAP